MNWIIVADAANARIFSAETLSSTWSEISDLVHPESRQKISELYRDQPNVTSSSSRPGKDIIEPTTDLKEKEAEIFARQVSDHLEESHLKDEFHRLHLIAAPSFLGTLRPMLHKGVQQKVVTTLDKNLTKMDVDTIKGHLNKFINSAA